MELKPIAANQTELHLNDGAVVFFSYKTPVAAQLAEGGLVRTACRWSMTTTRHINKWLDGRTARTIEQSELDSMVKS